MPKGQCKRGGAKGDAKKVGIKGQCKRGRDEGAVPVGRYQNGGGVIAVPKVWLKRGADREKRRENSGA